jgi:hypothetical protein
MSTLVFVVGSAILLLPASNLTLLEHACGDKKENYSEKRRRRTSVLNEHQ